jgi:hypothetical protein
MRNRRRHAAHRARVHADVPPTDAPTPFRCQDLRIGGLHPSSEVTPRSRVRFAGTPTALDTPAVQCDRRMRSLRMLPSPFSNVSRTRHNGKTSRRGPERTSYKLHARAGVRMAGPAHGVPIHVVNLLAHGYHVDALSLQALKCTRCARGCSARHLPWMTPLHRSTTWRYNQWQAGPAPARRRRSRQPEQSSHEGTSVNRVILVGRLVAKPELRETGNGIHVTTVRVATNDREQAEFHDVVLWRQHADFAVTYLTKGRQVYVEGRLQARTWDGRRRNAAAHRRGCRRQL